MKHNPRSIGRTLWLSLKLQCPVCGEASIVQRPFNLKHHCTACGVIFKREEGFFVGAIMANVVATEIFVLVTYFACLLVDLNRSGDAHDPIRDRNYISHSLLPSQLEPVAGDGSSD